MKYNYLEELKKDIKENNINDEVVKEMIQND